MLPVLAHITDPIHNTVAHTLDNPVIAVAVLAAIIATTVVMCRVMRKRDSRKR